MIFHERFNLRKIAVVPKSQKRVIIVNKQKVQTFGLFVLIVLIAHARITGKHSLFLPRLTTI